MTDKPEVIGLSKPEPYVFGRPSKYKPEFCMMLIEHMEKGYTFESFGAVINVTRDTLYKWSREHEDFLYAKNVAMLKCQQVYERWGVAGMMGKVKGFQANCWVFNMKARFKWSDQASIADEDIPDGFEYDLDEDF